MDFLRRCPACGRRFVVKVEKKALADAQQDMERMVHYVYAGPPPSSRSGYYAPVMVQTEENIPIERETFQVQYICNHCHHEWSENITVIHKT